MNWKYLTTEAELEELIQRSTDKAQLIFKHSTRCSISDLIRNRLEKKKAPEDVDFYFLDLIRYRSLSNAIAEKFSVRHESPQVLLIKNGECVYEESHIGISMDEIIAQSMAA